MMSGQRHQERIGEDCIAKYLDQTLTKQIIVGAQ